MPIRTPTLLSLQEYADVIGLNPFYLFQGFINVPENAVFDCEQPTFEMPDKASNHLTREDIRQAISQAEQLFADLTNFYPAPKFIVNEQNPYPRSTNRLFMSGMGNRWGEYKSVTLQYGHVQSMGTESLTEHAQAIVIIFNDTDGDGIDDQFEIAAVVPSGTVASSIHIYNTASDRADAPLDEYEIKPITVTVSGVNATIKGGAWLLFKPELQNRFAPSPLDVTDATNYVTDVDIYTMVVDTSEQGALIYPAYCPDSDESDCGEEQVAVCYFNNNAVTGTVAPRWLEWCVPSNFDSRYYAPKRYKANYYAGYPRQSSGKMHRQMAEAIAKLATSLMPNRTCGCQRSDQRFAYYRDLPVNDQGQLVIAQSVVDSAGAAFGTQGRGGCEAWVLIQKWIMYRGTVHPG